MARDLDRNPVQGVDALGDNPCALNVATTYMVDGAMPARDVSCRAA